MQRVTVDFNTLNSAPIDLVKIAGPHSPRRASLPPLADGERVLLADTDLEAEGLIVLTADGWIMARPDPATYRDIPVSEDYLRQLHKPMSSR
ncbi:MAG TPA: hypothetical protein VJN88_17400 [Ktedonobacterales bacterium]|nr:hypothetical protein [Ktedonobacterales bacterium]